MFQSCRALKVCKCACWKQSSAVKTNTVGSLVSWHDRLWLAQLSSKENHSFGKWHAPGSKEAWKSGCFSYSQEMRTRPTERLCTVPGCSSSRLRQPLIHINSLLWHCHMILHCPKCLLDTVRVYISVTDQHKQRPASIWKTNWPEC